MVLIAADLAAVVCFDIPDAAYSSSDLRMTVLGGVLVNACSRLTVYVSTIQILCDLSLVHSLL